LCVIPHARGGLIESAEADKTAPENLHPLEWVGGLATCQWLVEPLFNSQKGKHMLKKSILDALSKRALLGGSCLAGLAIALAAPALAQDQQSATQQQEGEGQSLEEVVVTGFRGSLQNSVAAKRENINFSDSVFAEDIGKFPDLNLAESLQRVPGVQIQRDVTGEGTSVSIRGLGRDFTQITLNGARVETASDSNIDGVSQGRGLDLVLFPTELFRQLTVSKTPSASQVEGAVAANIDLRIARPFDDKGFHINYVAKGNYQEASEEFSPRLGLYASNTWDTGLGEFGVLGGVAYSNRKYRSDGFNTIGYTTVSVGAQCPTSQPGCNSQSATGVTGNPTPGFGNASQAWATAVPVGYESLLNQHLYDHDNNAATAQILRLCGAGDTPGGTSGIGCNQLSYAIWPRLARPDMLIGERETTSGILSLQWASPSENLQVYLDTLYSEADHPYERNDLNLAVRGVNNNIPLNVQIGENNVVTSATLANPQWLNENRPYHEVTDFLNVNTGLDWKLGEKWAVDASFNYNHSNWFRSTNTYLFNSNLNSGITVGLESTGDGVYRITPSQDLNNVNFWNWNALRIQPVERDVYQKGGRFAVEFALNDAFKVRVGATQDNFHREVTSWEATACATDGTGAAPENRCAATIAAAGVQNARVAVPNAQLGNFLVPWRHPELYNTSDFDVGLNAGWALPNYELLDEATNIDYFENVIGRGLGAGIYSAGYTPRVIEEDTLGSFVEFNGQLETLGELRYNAGVRRIQTDQIVTGYVTNAQAGNIRELQRAESDYTEYLPSFNVSSNLNDSLVLRVAGSRTMTRPAPGDIAPNEALSVNADVLTRGNPALDPYFADQADLGLEWYFGNDGLGMIAANVWVKSLEGFTTIRNTNVPFGTLGIDFNSLPVAARSSLITRAQAQTGGASSDPNIALVRVDQRQNTDETIKLYGLELTYNQPLDFLLQGAGVTFNYTNISQYSVGGAPGAPSSAVTGLSKYTYNVTTFYENHGFMGRLSYAFRDAYINFLGNNENNIQGDNWSQPQGYLDASFSYKLPFESDLSISLELQNITNEQQLVYFRNDPQTPRASFAPGRQMLIGISGSF
jgi:TonB-dependent receptor